MFLTLTFFFRQGSGVGLKIKKTKTRKEQEDVPGGNMHKERKIRKKLTVLASK